MWRNWLGTRGLGLVPVREPATFSWPGPWLALLSTGTCVVAFGSPPGIAWNPLATDEQFSDVQAGYLVAPADVAFWDARAAAAAPHSGGRVEALAVAVAAEAPVVVVGEARAVAGRGLEGDRYFDGIGTFSNVNARGHDLTLVEAEALEELGVTAEAARRNVVTRGIDLNALVGLAIHDRRGRVPRPAPLRAMRAPRASCRARVAPAPRAPWWVAGRHRRQRGDSGRRRVTVGAVSAALPTGTVTFVFTDIEGSTKLLQELGDGYAEVSRDHRRIIREAFGARGGTEIDTQGDSFFYSFPRARDAVTAAVVPSRCRSARCCTCPKKQVPRAA